MVKRVIDMKHNFNNEQLQAIDSPIDVNTIVSAGAGSGKTTTLSYKISQMLLKNDKNHIDPEKMLVLTFTNNSANDMRNKIVDTFIKEATCDEKDIIGDKLRSAHIQTFDSFCNYLVKKYSSRLKIADNFALLDGDVDKALAKNLIDKIIDEQYLINQKDRWMKSVKKFGLTDDKLVRQTIKDLYFKLQNMLPKKREDFVNDYAIRYLSDDAYYKYRKEYNQYFKDIIYYNVVKTNIYDKLKDEISGINSKKIKKTNDILSAVDSFTSELFNQCYIMDYQSIDNLEFESKSKDGLSIQELYDILLDSYSSDNAIKSIDEQYKKYENSESNLKLPTSRSRGEQKELFANLYKDSHPVSMLRDVDNDKYRYQQFKEDILLFFEIINEVETQLKEYKDKNALYTFKDIQEMTLLLLTEEENKDILKEVKDQFDFILIDEYQDTNDLQEEVINALTCNESAHVFAVGDPKQSIYAFRNSNVELFNKRVDDAKNAGKGLICMNTNYRSFKSVLDDINYLFTPYMTLDHGGVAYKDYTNQLVYGGYKEKIEKEERSDPLNKGIVRILCQDNGGKPLKSVQSYNECMAIISDIKYKVEKLNYKYSDFYILVRTKSKFDLYKKYFNENDIPLNCMVKENLQDFDSIKLILSILKLVSHFIKIDSGIKSECCIKHCYLSIARSYAFDIDDSKALNYVDSISNDEQLSNLLDDEIFNLVNEFIKDNKHSTFTTLFSNLINKFHVIEKLYSTSDLQQNIDNIEYLYSLIVSKTNAGEGISEFIDLFDQFDKQNVTVSSSSNYKSVNAVSLMTIHASKGLEAKIVYLPVSLNGISVPQHSEDAEYKCSKSMGTEYDENGKLVKDGMILLFNDYAYEYEDVNTKKKIKTETLESAPLDLYLDKYQPMDKNSDKDEQVRLNYVALTRAKEAIYFVGNDYEKEMTNKTKESIYGILDYAEHSEKFTNPFIKYFNDNYKDYKYLLDKIDEIEKQKKIYRSELNNSIKGNQKGINKETTKAVNELFNSYADKKLDEAITRIKIEILKLVFIDLQKELNNQYYIYIRKGRERDFVISFYNHSTIDNIKTENEIVQELNKEKAFVSELSRLQGSSDDEIDDDETDSLDDQSNNGDTTCDTPENDLYNKALKYFTDIGFKESKIGILDENDCDVMINVSASNLDDEKKYYVSAVYSLLSFLHPHVLEGENIFYTSYRNETTYNDKREVLYEDKIINYPKFYKDRGVETEAQSKEIQLPTVNDIEVSDEQLTFEDKVKRKASDHEFEQDNDKSDDVTGLGSRLHLYMQNVNFTSRDTSFIKDKHERDVIDGVLKIDFLKNVCERENDKKGATFVFGKEVKLYSKELDNFVVIDLLLKLNDDYIIVDYKTKDISNPAYDKQLNSYKDALSSILKSKGIKSNIKMYLLSLVNKTTREVK